MPYIIVGSILTFLVVSGIRKRAKARQNGDSRKGLGGFSKFAVVLWLLIVLAIALLYFMGPR